MAKLSVALAYPWVDADGKTHAPDEVVSIDAATARELVSSGRARFEKPKEKPPAPTPGVVAPPKKEPLDG